jgi:thiamine biosynthesis lipoprotein
MNAHVARVATAWTWRAMATTWRIYHQGGVDGALARAATAQVAADEDRWTRFRDGGDVARLNAAAGLMVTIAPETAELLAAATRWQAETDGVFDPLVGSAVVAWGYGHSLRVADPGVPLSPRAQPLPRVRLVLDVERRLAQVPPGALLDLGGIAKGFAAARLASLLRRSCDDEELLLDAGGDLVAVRGSHVIGVEGPGTHHRDAVGPPVIHVRLRAGQGVATSGCGRRAWRNGDGVPAHHLIDPATGAPAQPAQATVIADDPVAADVLATALCVRPGLVVGRREPCLVQAHGRWHSTPAWDLAVAP